MIGNLRVSEAQAVYAAQSYEQTVLTALQEAESALARYEGDVKTVEALEESVEKETQACFIVEKQYEQGYANRTQLLQIKMDLNMSEEEQLNSRSNTLIDLIVLYKTLGGDLSLFLNKGKKFDSMGGSVDKFFL